MVKLMTTAQALEIHRFVVDARDLVRKQIAALQAVDSVFAHVAKTRHYDVRAQRLIEERDSLQAMADEAQQKFNERWANKPLVEPTGRPKKRSR